MLVSAAIGALVGVGVAPKASAQVTQPTLDLGQTSFLDGEAGPGAMIEVIADGNWADRLIDANGGRVSGRNRLHTASVIIHPAYVSDIRILGGRLGIEGLLPLATVHTHFGDQPAMTSSGFADATVAPFVQWSSGSLLGRPLSVRAALQVTAPTGNYSSHRLSNIGLNLWQISPYVAFTLHASTRIEVSGRAMYDWSGTNHAPAISTAARSIRPGDQAALNLSASYAASAHWRVGLSAYALQQLSRSEINAVDVQDSRQRVFGIGPGIRWQTRKLAVLGTAYREFGARNRPEGDQFVVRVLRPL